MTEAKLPIDAVIEVSFEGGHKVGGIYTVLLSKSEQMRRNWGDNYFLIGFYWPDDARTELVPEEPPPEVVPSLKRLADRGIICHWGRWVRGSNVRLILVEAGDYIMNDVPSNKGVDKRINVLKWDLWKDYGVDSMMMGHDFNEPIGWSTACGEVIEELTQSPLLKGKRVVAQFHEWLAGGALLHLHKQKSQVGLVFTTHATILGRSIASSGRDLFRMVFEGAKKDAVVDPHEAYNYKCEGKHLMEVACAKNADAFTTVSKTTAKEAGFILGQKVDAVLPNALDFSTFGSAEKLSVSHAKNRKKVKRFLRSYFAPFYDINLLGCLIFYTCGRYEFSNKGIDIFIEALGELNKRLKKQKDANEVYAFVWVPSGIAGMKDWVLRTKVMLDRLEELVDEELENVRFELIDAITSQDMKALKKGTKVSDRFVADVTGLVGQFKREGTPPHCAFNLMYDENHDMVINHLKRAGLNNGQKDKVRVIHYPSYLTKSDQVLGLSYYEALNAGDMGVFPSRYEPWGYTPAEAAAQMALSVTTDQAGFGQFVLENTKGKKRNGIQVLAMEGKKRSDVVAQLADFMEEVALMDKDDLIELKLNGRDIAELSDWRRQVENYIAAYGLALEGSIKRVKS